LLLRLLGFIFQRGIESPGLSLSLLSLLFLTVVANALRPCALALITGGGAGGIGLLYRLRDDLILLRIERGLRLLTTASGGGPPLFLPREVVYDFVPIAAPEGATGVE
jgi:hypothetical protein